MRHVREVLRLRTAGISGNEIARRLNLAPSTVRLTLQRLTTAGLDWPLPAELTDAALEARLFSAVGTKQGHRRRAEPDWAEVHRELKRKHVTLQILWDEYIERHPDGYQTIKLLVAEGDLVAAWATYKGTQQGPMGPFPPSGRKVEFDFGAVFRIEGGKIAEWWVSPDNEPARRRDIENLRDGRSLIARS